MPLSNHMSNFATTFSDISVMIKRNLLRYQRLPKLIIFSFIQPVMFVLLFAYVFGGAIQTGSTTYIQYLLPGILVQTVLFGSMMTGVGLAEDMTKGIIDRFRSLPIARSAVLASRTITEALRNVFMFWLMTITGFFIGFRIEHSIFNFLIAMIIAVLFAFAFSWVSATVGLTIKNVETAEIAGFIWVFPLTFASSIFVPVKTMVPAVRTFATHNPVSYTVNTVRALSLGTPVGNDLWYSLAWILGILIVFVPLAIYQYRKIS